MYVHLLITYRFHVSKGSLVNVFLWFWLYFTLLHSKFNTKLQMTTSHELKDNYYTIM